MHAPGHAVPSSLETFIATCKPVTHGFITSLWSPVRVGIPCGSLTHRSSVETDDAMCTFPFVLQNFYFSR